MNKLQLKNVTAIIIETRSDTRLLRNALKCIDISCEYVDFYESVFITSATNKSLIPPQIQNIFHRSRCHYQCVGTLKIYIKKPEPLF